MSFDLACTGQSVITAFHGLSGGKTSSAEQIASASGVSNMTGLLIGGIDADLIRASRTPSSPSAAQVQLIQIPQIAANTHRMFLMIPPISSATATSAAYRVTQRFALYLWDG